MKRIRSRIDSCLKVKARQKLFEQLSDCDRMNTQIAVPPLGGGQKESIISTISFYGFHSTFTCSRTKIKKYRREKRKNPKRKKKVFYRNEKRQVDYLDKLLKRLFN